METSVKAGQGGTLELALLDAEAANEAAEQAALESQRLARSAALARRIGRRSGDIIVVERPSGLLLPADSGVFEKFAIRRTLLRLALLKREEAARARLLDLRGGHFAHRGVRLEPACHGLRSGSAFPGSRFLVQCEPGHEIRGGYRLNGWWNEGSRRNYFGGDYRLNWSRPDRRRPISTSSGAPERWRCQDSRV